MVGALLRLVPGWAKIAAVALVAATVIGALYAVKEAIYRRGYDDALERVQAQNRKADKLADDARTAVDLCFDTGGTWDVSTGRCRP